MKKHLEITLFILIFLWFTIIGYTQALNPQGATQSEKNNPRGRGIVRGWVVNHHHKPLANAHIQLKHISARDYPLVLTAVTNKRGRWSIAGVGNVKWSLKVTIPGYNPSRQTVRTRHASDQIPLIQTVLRRIVEIEVLGLADLESLSFKSREAIAKAIGNGDSNWLESFIRNNKENLSRDFYIAVGNGYFDNEDFRQAMNYFTQIGFKRGANRIGDTYLKQNLLDEALKYYHQGIPSEKRALAYSQKAEYFKRKNNQRDRKKYLILAREDYDAIIRNCTFSWKNESNVIRRRTMQELDAFPKTKKQLARGEKIDQTPLGGGLLLSAAGK